MSVRLRRNGLCADNISDLRPHHILRLRQAGAGRRKGFPKDSNITDDTCIEFAKGISKPRSNTSPDTGVRGVILKDGKYVAQITFRKQRYYLGRFSRLEDAIEIQRKAEARVEEYVEEYLSGNPSPSVNFDF